MPKKMTGGRKPCNGWISDDDMEISDDGAMRVIDGLVAETGYNADEAKKAAKKVRFDERTATANRRGKEHGKKDRAGQIDTTSGTPVPRPSNNANVVIHDVKEEPIEAMAEDQPIESVDVEPRRVSKKKSVKETGVGIKEKRKEFGGAGSSSGPVKNPPVLRKGKQPKKGKGKQSAEITWEMSNGAKKFTWKNRITNGKKSSKNVMHFPREIAKKCLRVYQDEIKVVDVETREVFNCSLHKASRKGVPNTYERYMAQGWYELAKSIKLCTGDTLIWSMLRFSPYVYLTVEKRRRN